MDATNNEAPPDTISKAWACGEAMMKRKVLSLLALEIDGDAPSHDSLITELMQKIEKLK